MAKKVEKKRKENKKKLQRTSSISASALSVQSSAPSSEGTHAGNLTGCVRMIAIILAIPTSTTAPTASRFFLRRDQLFADDLVVFL